jgi:uncharacterized protein (DUF983 family)
MLFSRLARRFVLVVVLTFLAIVLVNATVGFPIWVYLLSIPSAAFLTFLYWQTFKGTMVCPTCNGTGKTEMQHGRDIELEICYSCDGEGRVPTYHR